MLPYGIRFACVNFSKLDTANPIFWGLVGSVAYFICVKTNFVPLEKLPSEYENQYLWDLRYIAFFCCFGGILAVAFETNVAGSLVQGMLIRPTLIRLMFSEKKGG